MHSRPSEIMGIEDAYAAFCFDEACAVIIRRINDGETPIIRVGTGINGEVKHYSRPSEIYNTYK